MITFGLVVESTCLSELLGPGALELGCRGDSGVAVELQWGSQELIPGTQTQAPPKPLWPCWS